MREKVISLSIICVVMALCGFVQAVSVWNEDFSYSPTLNSDDLGYINGEWGAGDWIVTGGDYYSGTLRINNDNAVGTYAAAISLDESLFPEVGTYTLSFEQVGAWSGADLDVSIWNAQIGSDNTVEQSYGIDTYAAAAGTTLELIVNGSATAVLLTSQNYGNVNSTYALKFSYDGSGDVVLVFSNKGTQKTRIDNLSVVHSGVIIKESFAYGDVTNFVNNTENPAAMGGTGLRWNHGWYYWSGIGASNKISVLGSAAIATPAGYKVTPSAGVMLVGGERPSYDTTAMRGTDYGGHTLAAGEDYYFSFLIQNNDTDNWSDDESFVKFIGDGDTVQFGFNTDEQFQIGLNGTLSTAATTNFTFGNSVLIVGKLVVDGSGNETLYASSYLSSGSISAEPTSWELSVSGVDLGESVLVDQVQLSVGSQNSAVYFDEIRMGDNFGDVVREPATEIEWVGDVTITPLNAVEVELAWPAEQLGTYAVQTKADLGVEVWSNLVEDITGIDGSLSITTAISSVKSFYRVVGE